MTTITKPNEISAFTWLARRGAVRLEAAGMKHSSGRSVSAMCKRELGLKPRTPHTEVIKAIEAKIKELIPGWEPKRP